MKKATLILSCLVTLVFSCKEKDKKEAITTEEIEVNKKDVTVAKEEVTIHPIEHATLVVDYKDKTIYIDPTLGAAAFEGQKKADIILITDIHGDHYSQETLNELPTDNALIIAPKAVVEQMPEDMGKKVHILNNDDSLDTLGITVKAIPMYNLREEALKFHTKGRGNGYVLTLGEERLYFSGDTEDIPEMRALENIDKAFVCMNLPYTMTVESAADGVLAFAPKKVYPYHYRGNPDVSDVSLFKELIEKGNPDIEVVQLDWYPKDDF